MGLSSNLRTMDLPEVLQWLANGRKTGTLYFRRGSIEKRLTFQEGALYSSWSNDPRESLGQYLIRDHRVTEEQLLHALMRQETEPRMLGGILVNERLLTSEQLREVLRKKAQETVYDLFLWPDGDFEFHEGELPEIFPLGLPLTEVILEGIRRVDEWKRIRARFPSGGTTFRVVPDRAPPVDDGESEALALAAVGRTLAGIALEMRRSEFEAATLLFALYERGLLVVDRVPEEAPTIERAGTAADLLRLANDHMANGRHDAALDHYEQVLGLDRLNQQAKKGVLAATAARDQAATAPPALALHKVPVAAMDVVAMTSLTLDPQEGFVLSRINGQWDIRSILKICPFAENEALRIFGSLLDRKVIELR